MSHRILLLMLCSLAPGAGGAARSTQPSAPINPPVLARSPGEATEPATEPAVEAIVTAVREHPIVAIGETHGSADLRAFLVGLSRDRSFREVTDTIAVEVSSSAQATIDAFLDGSADDHTLLDALRDGIFSETGAADPRSIDLYQAIRDANRDSDATHQLRVLAVDAPLSWAKVDAAADLAAVDREQAMASALTGLLDQDERALWIVGAAHVTDAGTPPPAAPSPGVAPVRAANARRLIERTHPGSVYALSLYSGFGPLTAQFEPRLGTPAAPSVISISATCVAALPSSAQGSPNAPGQVLIAAPGAGTAGPAQPLPSGPPPQLGAPAVMALPDGGTPATIGDSFDGLLYLGACNDLRADLPPRTVFDDPTYRAELDRRFRATRHHPFDPDEFYSVTSSLFGRC